MMSAQQIGVGAVERLRSVSTHHWRELDGIRGLAVLMVVVYHANLPTPPADSVLARLFTLTATTGWVGVRLFFVLSGFLIAGILLDSRNTPFAFRRFLIRRSLRIFPPYFVVLGVCIWLLPLLVEMPEGFARARESQHWYWFYLSNWAHPIGEGTPALAHTWSLGVEEQFYLLAPLAILWMAASSLHRLVLAAIAIPLLVRIALTATGHSLAAYMFTVAQIDALALGCLLALTVRDTHWSARLAGLDSKVLWVPLALLVLLFVARRGMVDTDEVILTVGQSIIAIAAVALIVAVAMPKGERITAVDQLLSSPALVEVGRLSYGIYLLHLPILHFVQADALRIIGAREGSAALPYRVAVILIVFVVSYVLAVIMDRLLDAPTRRLKEVLAPRNVSPRPPAPEGLGL